MNDTNWRDRALCAEVAPELFFPDKGDNSKPARKICGRCEVAAACLADALTLPTGQDHGIRGGLTREERDRMRGAA